MSRAIAITLLFTVGILCTVYYVYGAVSFFGIYAFLDFVPILLAALLQMFRRCCQQLGFVFDIGSSALISLEVYLAVGAALDH